MTEISLGLYMAVATVDIFMILATIVAYEQKATIWTIVIAQFIVTAASVVLLDGILAAFGG